MAVNRKNVTCIGIVVGETSGDQLAAPLINALKKQYPNAEFVGIAGPLMQQQGMHSWFDMQRLSVMGLLEVLSRLFELLSIRHQLFQRLLDKQPDLFIGVDAPDFNLPLAKKLRQNGIKTIHYVCPSIWAWRPKRIHKIKKSVHHVLCLLPFEVEFCEKYQLSASYVGHTLAKKIPLKPNQRQARKIMQLGDNDTYFCVMPGSRQSEIKRMLPVFLQVCHNIKQTISDIKFLIPCANDASYRVIKQQLALYAPSLPVVVLKQQSQQALIAADGALITSGTAALEAMLCKTPMVVSYKANPITFAIISRLLTTDHVSLPNIIAAEPLIPELLQTQATVPLLTQHCLTLLQDSSYRSKMLIKFEQLHKQMQVDSEQVALQAIDTVLKATDLN